MVPKSLERSYEEVARFEMIEKLLEDNPNEMTHLRLPLVRNQLLNHRRTIECVEQGKPFVMSYYSNAPEIHTALDLHWFMIVGPAFGAAIDSPHAAEDLEGMDKLAVASDSCTLLRASLYYVAAGLMPKPTALVAMIEPCDGLTGMHEVIRNLKGWRDVPMFAPDPPYFKDDRSLNYFAQELRNMTAFLEEHTGRKLDMDRLKEVVEESNKQYQIWAEYTELRRSKPCPHGYMLGLMPFGIVQGTNCGRPEGTESLQALLEDAENRLRENRPEVSNERIRLLWFDIHPTWFNDISPWLEQEWGAVIIHTMLSYHPYTTVDTSSEEAMFRGLAKRNLLDTPMIRQAQGTAENFSDDIIRIVKDYSIDAVIWPGHMGHKDGSASISIMRETCRDIGVPFLSIGVDQFDRRYTTPDEIKDRLSQFFTAMDLG